MAAVLRDIVDAQAPGLFFGEGSSGVNYTGLVKEGSLEKLGRGRGLVSALMGKKWAARTFKLHEDGKMYYFDGTTPRGEFSVEKASIAKVDKDSADGHEHAFEISTKEGEKILVSAETAQDMEAWISILELLASGKWALYKHTDLLAQYAQITLTPPQRIDVVVDDQAFKAVMAADSYAEDRMIEILEEYLKELNSKVVRFVAEDAEFATLFKRKMFANRLRILPAEDNDTSRGYYRTAFNSEGELEIRFIKAWTNLSQLGDDLPRSISVGEDVPYLVSKCIRQRRAYMDANIQALEHLLQMTGITYDYCLHENLAAMVAAGYEEERFAEIIFMEHLRPVVEKLARCIAEDPQFREEFKARFTGKTIIIRPAKGETKTYYDSSFTPEGNVLIEYRQFWCNLGQLGDDFKKIFSTGGAAAAGGGGGNYEAQKSIRKYEATMKAYLQAIENLLGITGIKYDYCLDENFKAMVDDGYGEDRFGEIFLEEHLKPIVERLARFIAEDVEFKNEFNKQFTNKTIVVRPAKGDTKAYYDSSFVGGNLVIVYRRFWCNIGEMCADLEKIVSADGMYPAQKSIRKYEPIMKAYLQNIESLLGVQGVKYDYCLAENFKAMVDNDYGEDRFGEIFLEEHLKPIVERLQRFIGEDAEFRNAFARKFYNKTIIIRPAEADTKAYYDSSFVNGNLLIVYRRFWCNIGEMGADFEQIL